MEEASIKLYNFLETFLYDLTFWYVFSVVKVRSGDHYFNGEYIDENEKSVSNIYKSEYHMNHVFCLHATELFDNYCGETLPLVNSETQIKNNQLYSVYVDIGGESHGFIIIRYDDVVYTINLYGGTGITFLAENDFDDFSIFWKLLNRSKGFEKDEHRDNLVNANFSIITGIEGMYPPYYLENIKVKRLNLNENVVNKIIKSFISTLKLNFRPSFKGRKEEKIIDKLAMNMEEWVE